MSSKELLHLNECLMDPWIWLVCSENPTGSDSTLGNVEANSAPLCHVLLFGSDAHMPSVGGLAGVQESARAVWLFCSYTPPNSLSVGLDQHASLRHWESWPCHQFTSCSSLDHFWTPPPPLPSPRTCRVVHVLTHLSRHHNLDLVRVTQILTLAWFSCF